MPEKLGIHLPRVFEASDGRADCEPPKGGDTGILLRDTSLAALMVHAGRGYAVAVGPAVGGLEHSRQLEMPSFSGIREPPNPVCSR